MITPKVIPKIAPTHPVAKAAVAAVHKVATAVLRKVAPNAKLRPYGLHPLAWALYLQTGLPVSRLGQCIGHAAASAGTHVKTGQYQGHDYGPCCDLRVSDLTHAQVITQIVRPLAALGLVVFLRVPGEDEWPKEDEYHVHWIFAACNLTPQVDHQVRDFLAVPTLNGLAKHLPYHAYQTTHDEREACQRLYAQHQIVQH